MNGIERTLFWVYFIGALVAYYLHYLRNHAPVEAFIAGLSSWFYIGYLLVINECPFLQQPVLYYGQ